jgi:UDP:flavonoid glycosyltransferase YjiC (YdhE family)
VAKIIVAAPPVLGELTPLLQLGRGLAARGHWITVLTGSRFRVTVENAGLGFAPLHGTADYDIGQLMALPERDGLQPGPALLNSDWIHAFVNPMPDQHAVLQELLDEDPDQYLISNVLFLGAWPTRLGAPGRRPLRWVAVSAAPLALNSGDTTFFGPVPVGPGEDAVAANRAANAQFAAAMRPTQDRFNELLSELGATPADVSFVDGIVTLPDATAALTVPGFEFARSDLPASVHLVGILPTRQDGWEPPAWWPDLEADRPIVVVTQGTLANGDLSQLVEPTLAALADSDVTVVAALGRDPGGLHVPANARVAEFIPFHELLPRAAVFITNGGSGGLHQALAAGVPAIVAGETEDKPANAARVEYHGLGFNLRTATPEPKAIKQATDLLLKDTDVRENVRKLAEVYASHDAVTEIERLVLTPS